MVTLRKSFRGNQGNVTKGDLLQKPKLREDREKTGFSKHHPREKTKKLKGWWWNLIRGFWGGCQVALCIRKKEGDMTLVKDS